MNTMAPTLDDLKATPQYVECPHCQGIVQIEEINCRIFRHGVFISSGLQVPPHESKENCDKYSELGLIYGCGKPFMLSDTLEALVCDYI